MGEVQQATAPFQYAMAHCRNWIRRSCVTKKRCWLSWMIRMWSFRVRTRWRCRRQCSTQQAFTREDEVERSKGETVRMWRVAAYDPTAVVWRGSDLPTHRQGLNVPNTPVGHPDFARTSLENIGHQCFLDRIPLLEDGQPSWLLYKSIVHEPTT